MTGNGPQSVKGAEHQKNIHRITVVKQEDEPLLQNENKKCTY
jgi:hypothetical protein